MILVNTKADVKPASPLNLSTPDEKPSSSFGELLKGVSVKGESKELKDDSKIVQNGALVLSLEDSAVATKGKSKGDEKLDTLLSLLQNTDKKSSKEDPLELNPKVTENLSPKEIKLLVKDAKNYLKEQIVQSDGYKQAQSKELPQTLKGLASLAKKFDIDISKITLEQIQVKTTIKQTAIDVDVIVDADENSSKKLQAKNTDIDEPVDIKQEVKSDKKTAKIVSANPLAIDATDKKEVKADLLRAENRADTRVEQKAGVNPNADIKQTPIFKAQTTKEVTTTEQVVIAKQFRPLDAKTPKEKADDTLKLLLRGEKPSAHSAANLTADFSVATAKVIAPKAVTEAAKSLETLLRGDSSNPDNLGKTEQLSTHKADSFEVKLNEAKQMVKYLSSDVKNAIDDYKSPFTRIKVQLNPQRLGEIDLTVIQRGKNLHVNFTSNNVAINALALNVNDLKAQLSNNGINNATFNFNSGSEAGSSNSGQQQNRQNEQKQANEEYNYFDNEEQNEEVLSSLEIVVPSYA